MRLITPAVRMQGRKYARVHARSVRMGNRICELLQMVYETKLPQFKRHAAQRGINIHQLAAAAICGMVKEEGK